MKRILKTIVSINWLKTLRVNFYYLPFGVARKLPVLISRGVRLRILKGDVSIEGDLSFGMIRIGFDTLGLVDWPRERTILENSGSMIFKGSVNIGAACRMIVMPGGKLTFGENVNITGRTSIICGKEIEIGRNSLLSWDIQIMDTDFHNVIDEEGNAINPPKAVRIGEHVWIGSRVTVLKGSEIPSDTVIAADTTVMKKLKENYVVFGGNPVHIIKSGINWKK